jgi:hypothetical protein
VPTKWKRALHITIGVMAGVGIAIQFIPVQGVGVNPPERFALDAPPAVAAILRESCFDCHSNETHWPWYAKVAPGSWLLARDVKKGRARFNMSEWGDFEAKDKAIDKEMAWEEIEKGEMPPLMYLPGHPGARLDDAEKALLKSWLLAPTPQ